MRVRRAVLALSIAAIAGGVVPAAAAHPRPQRATVVVEEVSIPVPGQEPLSAYLVRPDRDGKRSRHAGVLYLHWFEPGHTSADRDEFLPEAIALAQRGVVSVLPQQRFPWTGDPVGDERDLAAVTGTVDATRASFNYLARQDGVDRRRLAIVGHDYGAMYGMVVADTNERVAAAVFLAADARWANWFNLFWLGLEGDAEAQYFALYSGLDPVDHVGRLGERQLFQWAANDFFIPAAIRDQFATAAPTSPVRTYDGVNHSLDLNTAEADRIAFLTDQLDLPG